MSVTLITSVDELQDLKSGWTELSNRHRHPLLDFEWYACAAETLHSRDQLRTLVLRDETGRIDGIAPLAISDHHGAERIVFCGAPILGEPAGLLCRDNKILHRLYAAIADLPFHVELSRTIMNSKATVAPPRFARGIWLVANSSGTPRLELDATFSDFYAGLSGQRRYDYRRATRRAESLGSIDFQFFEATARDVQSLLDTCIEIEDRSWKAMAGSSLKRRPDLNRFFRRYAALSVTGNWLRVFVLDIGGVSVAMAICIEKYGSLWFLKIGYDAEYRKCSPGMLMLMKIVEYCFDRSIDRIEHLGTVEEWLKPWTSSVQPHSTLIHYPMNLSGCRAFGKDIRASLKKQTTRFSKPTTRGAS